MPQKGDLLGAEVLQPALQGKKNLERASAAFEVGDHLIV